jgi:hypothetical protein
MDEDIFNTLTAALAVVCLVYSALIYRLTRARAMLALVGAFGWACVVRMSISFGLPFVNAHSRPLTFITFALFTTALGLLYRELMKIYRGDR